MKCLRHPYEAGKRYFPGGKGRHKDLTVLNLFRWFTALDADIGNNEELNVYFMINSPEIIFQKQIRWSVQSLDPPAFLLFPVTEHFISLIWRQGKMDSNMLWRIFTITFCLKTQKLHHSWKWKRGHSRCFTHRINFALTVLEIRWQNLTANRTEFYKTVFWIRFPSFWESERHSQFQLSCEMVLNSDWAVMIFFQNNFGKLMFKELFLSDEWTILLLLAANLLLE